jgi:hypothetical protein
MQAELDAADIKLKIDIKQPETDASLRSDDLLPLEVEARRDGGLGREAPQATGRKPAPQEARR